MRLIQFDYHGALCVAMVESEHQVRMIDANEGTYGLAQLAISQGHRLTEIVSDALTDTILDYTALVSERRLLPPLTHADPAHCLITGTGLTHLGSASTRSNMHVAQKDEKQTITDSMRMFNLGVEGGKPEAGQVGTQPEWFYKGDGSIVVPPETPFPVPGFAEDAGEEPELAGLYLVGPDGSPWRVGYAIGNEFSDHVVERQNYLWLAHSKLRACSYGPELLIGELPESLSGVSRIVREGKVFWEKPFLSGPTNMSHSLSNLEHHHFKYLNFRRPGDVHVHYFGTATLSFADGVKTRDGDRFEIEIAEFGRPLRNSLEFAPDKEEMVAVKAL